MYIIGKGHYATLALYAMLWDEILLVAVILFSLFKEIR